MSPLVLFARFVTFMGKTPPIIQFYGDFNHFSLAWEVVKS